MTLDECWFLEGETNSGHFEVRGVGGVDEGREEWEKAYKKYVSCVTCFLLNNIAFTMANR